MHCLALAPFLDSEQSVHFPILINEAEKEGTNKFLHFLILNGLAPLWFEAITHAGQEKEIERDFLEKLRQVRLTAEANYLMQKRILQKIHSIFTESDIEYAGIKGLHVREQIYENPSLRPTTDLDVLVSKENHIAAIHALMDAGMEFKPVADNISHEATLVDGVVNIDLHWDILRPGRTRIDLTKDLLSTRQEFSTYWGVGIEETLLLMLVHPVFTKYLNSPNYSLIGILDLIKWIDKWEINWEKVYNLCSQGGVKTAAWLTGEWLKLLTGYALPNNIAKMIEPDKLQTVYLRYWLKNNLSSRFFNHSLLIQLFFTLPVHDKPSDAIKAVKQLVKEKRSAQKNMDILINAVSK